MSQEEQRKRVVKDIAEMMMASPFTIEYKVVKKPKGIKVIIEVTEEQMNIMMTRAKQSMKGGEQ